MTKNELKSSGVKIYLSPHSFHWVSELPKSVKLAINITPFRVFDDNLQEYIPKIGEIYFEKSQVINGYWLISIKDYTDFEKLSNYIINKLIFY